MSARSPTILTARKVANVESRIAVEDQCVDHHPVAWIAAVLGRRAASTGGTKLLAERLGAREAGLPAADSSEARSVERRGEAEERLPLGG